MKYRVLVWPWVKPLMDKVLANWLAITIGHTIIAARPLAEAELKHELVHVGQWDKYGLSFPIRYWRASATAAKAGGHWYWDNEFEIEAYRT